MRIGPFGIWEVLIIAVLLFFVFGARRLPEIAKGMTQSVREFRKGIKDSVADDEDKPQDAKVVSDQVAGQPITAASEEEKHPSNIK